MSTLLSLYTFRDLIFFDMPPAFYKRFRGRGQLGTGSERTFSHSESVHKAILGDRTHQNYDGESAFLRCARVLVPSDPTTRSGRYERREEKTYLETRRALRQCKTVLEAHLHRVKRSQACVSRPWLGSARRARTMNDSIHSNLRSLFWAHSVGVAKNRYDIS